MPHGRLRSRGSGPRAWRAVRSPARDRATSPTPMARRHPRRRATIARAASRRPSMPSRALRGIVDETQQDRGRGSVRRQQGEQVGKDSTAIPEGMAIGTRLVLPAVAPEGAGHDEEEGCRADGLAVGRGGGEHAPHVARAQASQPAVVRPEVPEASGQVRAGWPRRGRARCGRAPRYRERPGRPYASPRPSRRQRRTPFDSRHRRSISGGGAIASRSR